MSAPNDEAPGLGIESGRFVVSGHMAGASVPRARAERRARPARAIGTTSWG
jgi:hypothetical protein